jgi:hypothetical protein
MPEAIKRGHPGDGLFLLKIHFSTNEMRTVSCENQMLNRGSGIRAC